MEPGLHGHVSLAALPELQCIAPSLQAKLHAAMQTITKSAKPVPACHKGSGARPALCQIQHEIACLADAAAAASGECLHCVY